MAHFAATALDASEPYKTRLCDTFGQCQKWHQNHDPKVATLCQIEAFCHDDVTRHSRDAGQPLFAPASARICCTPARERGVEKCITGSSPDQRPRRAAHSLPPVRSRRVRLLRNPWFCGARPSDGRKPVSLAALLRSLAADYPGTRAVVARRRRSLAKGLTSMEVLACLNGETMPMEQARVPVWDRGFLFGDSVYEVFRMYRGRRWLEAEHLARLRRSLRSSNSRRSISNAWSSGWTARSPRAGSRKGRFTCR